MENENWESRQLKIEILQPWSTFVMRTQLPPEILEQMIKITDECIANGYLNYSDEQDSGGIVKSYTIAKDGFQPPHSPNSRVSKTHDEKQFSIIPQISKHKRLQEFFLDVCKAYVVQAYYQSQPFNKENIKNEEWLPYLTSMWINSQKDNEYFPIHFHVECAISTVMYLKIPEYLPNPNVSDASPQDGAITFTKTGETNKIWGIPTLQIQPQVGDFFIFPSEQLHQVYPFRTADGKGERRSVSFNAGFTNKSEQNTNQNKR